MIQWLLQLNKATMNVPPIPPPSVIETLILSKEFKGSKPFFSYLSLSILISKKATIFKKKTKTRKSLRVVTVFWLGKSNGLPPLCSYLLTKNKEKRLKIENFCTNQFILFLCNFFYISLYTKFFHLLEPLLPLAKTNFFPKNENKKKDYDDFQKMSWPPKKSDAEKFIINIYLRCIKYFSLISIKKNSDLAKATKNPPFNGTKHPPILL